MTLSVRGAAAILLLGSLALLAGAPLLVAGSENERVLSIYNIHNKETLSVVFKRNGEFVPEALKKLNWIARDWRRDEPTTMDPRLFDILWEIHTELGSKEPIHLVSGYRSKKTNDMLRRTRGGQARKSQHILGQAMDVHFPDIPVKRLRYSALVRERGGVGYYPTSATPFVHVDTGRVRHWPRMGREELALLFPNGRSKHRPSGDRPITRADVERARTRNPSLAQKVAAFHALRGEKRRGAGIMVASLRSEENASRAKFDVPRPVLASLGTPVDLLSFLSGKTSKPQSAGREHARMAALGGPTRSAFNREGLVNANEGRSLGDLIKRDREATTQQVATLGAADGGGVPTPRPAPASASSGLALGQTNNADRAVSLSRLAALTPEPRVEEVLDAPAIRTDVGGGQEFVTSDEQDAPSPLGEAARSLARAFLELTGWVSAPEYDTEHPGELSYRPFPVGPLLSANPSIDDPILARLLHPDQVGARALIGESDEDIPLSFKPERFAAEVFWSNEFSDGQTAQWMYEEENKRRRSRKG